MVSNIEININSVIDSDSLKKILFSKDMLMEDEDYFIPPKI